MDRTILHPSDITNSNAGLNKLDNGSLFMSDFINLKIDEDRMKNAEKVIKRYRVGQARGIPWMAILDADGKLLVTSDDFKTGNIGYPTQPNEIRHFMDMLQKTVQRTTPERLALKKPLYLMPGEVILGGSQDRTIAEETTIAATGKPVSIDVFCVEHGRWSGRNEEEASRMFARLAPAQQAPAAKKLAQEANRGKFVATAGSLSKAGRMAVQSGAGQQAVWDRVAMANAKSGVNSDSGAFTFNYSNDEVRAKLEPYLKTLTERIAQRDRVVGVVVAVNGKIESVDVFESTPLFRKLWPKLLKSYALDAFHASEDKVSKAKDSAKVCSMADATAFLEKIMSANKGGLVVTRRETKDSMSFSAGGATARMGGAFGGAVHAGGYAP